VDVVENDFEAALKLNSKATEHLAQLCGMMLIIPIEKYYKFFIN
jgi:hypothetical protein